MACKFFSKSARAAATSAVPVFAGSAAPPVPAGRASRVKVSKSQQIRLRRVSIPVPPRQGLQEGYATSPRRLLRGNSLALKSSTVVGYHLDLALDSRRLAL